MLDTGGTAYLLDEYGQGFATLDIEYKGAVEEAVLRLDRVAAELDSRFFTNERCDVGGDGELVSSDDFDGGDLRATAFTIPLSTDDLVRRVGKHIGCIGAVHAVHLDAAGRHKPEDLVSIEGTAALSETISNSCEPSVEDQHLGGIDLIGFALAFLIGEVFGRTSGSDGGLSFDERDCSQLLLIEVEELLYIDLTVC